MPPSLLACSLCLAALPVAPQTPATPNEGGASPAVAGLAAAGASEPGLVFTPDAVTVTEAPGPGRTATYKVALATKPTSDVIVRLISDDTGAATVSPGWLNFSTTDWNDGQTVTVTGVDDDLDNGSGRTVDIRHNVAGGGYGSVTGRVSVTVADDERRGVVVSKQALTVLEGESGSYTLRLGSRPAGKVTVTLSKTPSRVIGLVVLGERRGPLDPITATFDRQDWSKPKTVIVSSNDDDDTDDDTATISHVVTGYGDVVSADSVQVTVTDTSVPGVLFDPESVTVAEGGTATYTVKLATIPDGTVTVTPKSADDAVATVSGAVSLDAANWDRGLSVTVTGVEDDDAARDTTSVSHSVAGYHDVTSAGPVPVTVTDNDAALVLTNNEGVVVYEGLHAPAVLRNQTYRVSLAARPAGTVTVTPRSRDEARVAVSGPLTFDADNWAVGQDVVLKGVWDEDGDDHQVTIDHSVTGYDAPPATVRTWVKDYHGKSLVVRPRALRLDEGEAGTYSVKLRTDPNGRVTVTPAVADGKAATVSGALTFDSGNWSVAQNVTVTARRDGEKGYKNTTITHSVAGYSGYVETHPGAFFIDGDRAPVVSTVALTVTDDGPGLALSSTALTVTEAAGAGRTAGYTVALASRPTADVTVALASGDESVATVDPATLRFTASDWKIGQAVTVTGVDDDRDNTPDRTAEIALTASGGDYNGVTATVRVTVTDDDTPGVVVSKRTMSMDENGSPGTYTLRLATQPDGPVTVTLSAEPTGVIDFYVLDQVRDPADPITAPFDENDWDKPKTVAARARHDDDGEDGSVTISHTVTGYGGVTAADSVEVVIIDDDERGFVFTPDSVTVTEAAGPGRTATYKVTLATRPTADVSVALASGDATAATASPASLTFAASNWKDGQTVTVTGVDDDLDNGSGRAAEIGHTASGGGYGSVAGKVAVTVTDDEGAATFAIAGARVAEGDSGTADLTFTVTLSPAADKDATVAWATSKESADTATPGEGLRRRRRHARFRRGRDFQGGDGEGHRRQDRRGRRDPHRHAERRQCGASPSAPPPPPARSSTTMTRGLCSPGPTVTKWPREPHGRLRREACGETEFRR